ncbi:hypothetical protein FR698_02065 [Pelomicrobium methylotrophicum]|uniref:asparagine synthase (glutamine-hydrolyzing) n=1 Tax=Pelomicrobium methylotrophicum TaxID=2602750 RepID=A0A5C7F1I7_9PROT|nr:hypothetical protein FR698_02065 [Pelomicrobium methylotrophicum]
MCGLTGFGAPKGAPRNAARATAQRMADTLVHRGPDNAGVWVDDSAGLALAHRRLSLLDLSPAGHQSMVSASGRYVIAFNGEIYNHLELRKALTPGHTLRVRGEKCRHVRPLRNGKAGRMSAVAIMNAVDFHVLSSSAIPAGWCRRATPLRKPVQCGKRSRLCATASVLPMSSSSRGWSRAIARSGRMPYSPIMEEFQDEP